MELRVVSWDGHDLDDASFEAFFPTGSVMLQADGKPSIVERPHFAPYYVNKNRSARLLPLHIKMLGTISDQIDTIKTWFWTFDDDGLKKLTVRDESNYNRYWYVMATPISMPDIDGSEVVINLLVPDSMWFSDDTSTDTWNVTGTGQTHDIGISGNSSVDPVISISPQDEKSSGAAYRRFVKFYPVDGTTWEGEEYQIGGDETHATPIDIGDASFDTATLVSAGKMQSDGSDIQIVIDGVQSNYWLDDMNSGTTKIWINLPEQYTARQMTLGTAIASSGDIDTITIENTAGNLTDLENMPTKGIVLIGSEYFSYDGKSTTGLTLSGIKRARYGSSEAAHSASAAVIWIKHEIWLYYGNHGLPTFTVDNNFKPMFELDTSTNTSWDYNDFWQTNSSGRTLPRAAGWGANIYSNYAITTGTNLYYESMTVSAPDTQTSEASKTASVLGMFCTNGNFNSGSLAVIHPGRFTHITASGYKYQATGASWFDTKTFYTSSDADLLNEGAPGSPDTPTAWTQTNTAITATTGLSVYSQCVRSASTGESRFEAGDVTLTIDSNYVAVHSIGAEDEVYAIDAVLTNNTTGEYITISYIIPVGDELEIDTSDKTVIWTEEDINARSALGFSTIRYDWLQLQSGANELQYDETGAADIDITTEWKDRSS